MPSFRTSILAAATALVATVQADYYVEPSSVPLSTRQGWCASETSNCPAICQDQSHTGATVNTCDADTLSYGCLCGDGTQPNMSEYSLTLPYFVCTEWGQQCITQCGPGNNTCSAACRDDHPCGARNPTRSNATAAASSSTAGSTADSTTIYSGHAGQTGSSSSASRPPSFEMMRLYSTAGMLGLFSLGFAYLL